MIIVDKQTLETFEQHEVAAMHPHIMFDFSDPEIVGEVLDELGLAVLHMPDQPVFDSRIQRIEIINIAESGGAYSGQWSEPELIPGIDQSVIKALIAEKRWLEETSGVTYDGRRYPTDRDSQQVISTMFFMAQLNPAYSVKFKSLDGFVDLDAGKIIGLGQAVLAHVQGAFDREAQLLETEGATHLDW